MKPKPLAEQVWKHGSAHYKIIELLPDGSMLVLVRNGSTGRWGSQPQTLSARDLNHLEFVKGPVSKTNETPPQTFRTNVPKAKRYVITYAQNATPVHSNFLGSLLTYCKENQAELIVVPGRYKNPTSIWGAENKHDEWWDQRLSPYLTSKRLQLVEGLIVYSDISIQPTATRPLTGMEVFTGKSSAIFGHPKLQLLTVATNSRKPKLMTTTGSCTILNYTNSKTGKKAAAHHVFGATVVELDKGGGFHIRQINASKEDGSFIDLNWIYTATGKLPAPPAEALILGDIHAESVDDQALQASFDMIDKLQCRRAIYHDLLDFRVRNHHDIDSFTKRYCQTMTDASDIVEEELDRTISILEATPKCAEPIVIQSNHDEAFDRWLNTINPKTDPVNALLYHKMWVAKIEEFDKTGKWEPAFKLYYDAEGYTRARFINREEDCTIMGIVCGYHGDKGINGTKGTPNAYAKLGVKTIIGHRHTPSILDGCYTVGVIGKLNQGYNFLPSSWAHANCVIYANGKRSLIFIQPGTDNWRI